MSASLYIDNDSYSKYRGQYNTYFTTKAEEAIIGLHINKPVSADASWISYFEVSVFSGVSDGTVPTGKFTYEIPAVDETVQSTNGKLQAASGTFSITSLYGFADDKDHSVSVSLKDGSTPSLEIIKQENGRYTFVVEADVVIDEYYYDENWARVDVGTKEETFKATLTDVYCGVLPTGLQACPDGDVELSYVANSNNYMPWWFGDTFNTGCHVFRFGWNYVNQYYTVQLALNVKDDAWTFEKNFNNRHCKTPFKVGTFPFSVTVVEDSMIPLNGYHHITNTYTGHTYVITSGSIILTDSDITYDLTCTYQDQTFHVGGKHTVTMYYILDKHTSTPSLDM